LICVSLHFISAFGLPQAAEDGAEDRGEDFADPESQIRK